MVRGNLEHVHHSVCATLNKTMNLKLSVPVTRTHKNRQLEEECVTPIEAGSPVKIIELY